MNIYGSLMDIFDEKKTKTFRSCYVDKTEKSHPNVEWR